MPAEVREGVREGILAALAGEIDRTAASTAVRIGVAGALGAGTALLALVLFGDLRAEHAEHGWHLAVCAVLWATLLIECYTLVLLRVRLRDRALGPAAAMALVGLLLAGLLALACPESHYFAWWGGTRIGAALATTLGPGGSALGLGASAALAITLAASVILRLQGGELRGVVLPAALLFLLFWPAILLQAPGAAALAGASLGAAFGCVAGVAAARGLPRARRRSAGREAAV